MASSGKSRGLTRGEVALARKAFGDQVDYGKVKIVDGPGMQPLAHAAFAKGNPAITVGASIYYKTGFCADFSVAGADMRSFIHEMVHVWQYRKLGMPRFFLNYAEDLLEAGGRPDDMYPYQPGATRFPKAMIEQQAEIAADYGIAVEVNNAAAMARLNANMVGSGLYGL